MNINVTEQHLKLLRLAKIHHHALMYPEDYRIMKELDLSGPGYVDKMISEMSNVVEILTQRLEIHPGLYRKVGGMWTDKPPKGEILQRAIDITGD